MYMYTVIFIYIIYIVTAIKQPTSERI